MSDELSVWEPANKDEVLYLYDSGDARQMETNGRRLLLSSKHSQPLACFFGITHTHIPVSLLLFVHSLTKLSTALQDILFCHPVVASEHSYSSTTADGSTYHIAGSCLEKETAVCRLLDGHFDSSSNSQFRDGWHKNWSCSTMFFFPNKM